VVVNMPRYSDVVQGIFQELNELRRNPSGYANKLEHFLSQYHGSVRHRSEEVPVVTKEGPEAVNEAISVLRERTAPLRTFTWSEALSSAAQAHAIDLGPKGLVGHKSSDDQKSLQERLDGYGKWSGHLVEVLDFGGVSATEIVCSLLVDDGMPTREHREGLLTADLRQVGIGFGAHEEQRTMAVIILASKFQESTDYERLTASTDALEGTWEAKNWMEGAVKLTCEVSSETEGDVMRKRVTKRWEMADGSERVTEEIIYN